MIRNIGIAASAFLIFAASALPGKGEDAALKSASAAMTVEERLCSDQLMIPYYTGRVLPTPQKVEYKDEFIPMANVAIVVGKDVENPGPLTDLLVNRITQYGGTARVVAAPGADAIAVISMGDTGLDGLIKDIPAVPDKDQGYILQCVQANGKPLIILKGRDRLGLVWAISSLNQLIHWKDGKTLARAVNIVDYPRGQNRGYINANAKFMFYSPELASYSRSKDKTLPDTGRALEKERAFTVMCKFNMPVYQMVVMTGYGDRDHPGDGFWRTPEKWQGEFRTNSIEMLGSSLTPLGISWYGCVHPHVDAPENKMCGDEESLNALLYYARRMEAAGGHLDIQLDDVRFPLNPYDTTNFGSAREADTWIVTNLMARLKKDYPKAKLLVCPPFYWGPAGRNTYSEDRDEYLKAIGDRWPQDVDIWWSGERVNGNPLATKENVEWLTGLIKRKPFLWQNSAVTWYRAYFFHYGAEPIDTLKDFYWDGFLESIGCYGFNSDFPERCIATAVSSDFQWNPDAYNAQESVKEAASKFIGPAAWDTLKKFSETLWYFDRTVSQKNYDWFYGGPFHGQEVELRQYAGRNIDFFEEKLAEAEALYARLLAINRIGVESWTGCAHFLGIAQRAVAGFKSAKDLEVYRKAPAQRAVAHKAGDFSSLTNDYFLAASNFKNGLLCDVTNDVTDGKAGGDAASHPAQVLTAAQPMAEATQWFWKNDLLNKYELRVSARKGPDAGDVVITLNDKELFKASAPFGDKAPSSITVAIPDGLIKEKDNVLKISVTVKGGKELSEKRDAPPPLAIQYAVFKRVASNLSTPGVTP